ncbi:MAG: flagellar motor switch protein FliN [Gammaproteobacteria bacterium]|nr:flagellar motor switch protein FliN [Gammaproteobacteria bacterium]
MSEEAENVDQDAMADEWAAAMQEQGDDPPANAEEDNYQQVEAKPLANTSDQDAGDVKLDVILDIPVTIAMEIGRTKLSIRNLLQLNQGSVVELDRLAGEPMDVLVNGTLVAHGEVVVVNEKFGIRLTDVVSPADRIKNLR